MLSISTHYNVTTRMIFVFHETFFTLYRSAGRILERGGGKTILPILSFSFLHPFLINKLPPIHYSLILSERGIDQQQDKLSSHSLLFSLTTTEPHCWVIFPSVVANFKSSSKTHLIPLLSLNDTLKPMHAVLRRRSS